MARRYGGGQAREMYAKYSGRCTKCDEDIIPGQRIVFLPAKCERPRHSWQKQAHGIVFHAWCLPLQPELEVR